METTGRFAPSPSGRLHLGNLLCALLVWLSARQKGGRVLLRVEDLDTARCPRRRRARQMPVPLVSATLRSVLRPPAKTMIFIKQTSILPTGEIIYQ